MTPETHARLLLDFLTLRGTYDHVVAAVYDDEAACAAVRDYLRQVILEEREACAQIVEQGYVGNRVETDFGDEIRGKAAAIRARA